jgi:hypothetical protein
MRLRPANPAWGRLPAIIIALMCALVLPAAAQPKGKKADKPEPAAGAAKEDGGGKADAAAGKADGKAAGKKDAKPAVKNFDFTDFNLNGKMRTPQLLYFLERANEELERASLEKRSFIPHMVRTVEEEAL